MKPIHEEMADKMAEADGGGDDMDESPDYGEEYKSAVAQFVDAVHSKDTDGAAEALKTAISLCSKAGHDEPDEDDAPGGHAALLLMPHGKA